jgi:hypothetical protein
MSKSTFSVSRFVAVLSLAGVASTALGALIPFTRLSNNSDYDASNQFFVEMLSPNASQVQFVLTNTGPQSSSATGWYFDDALNALFSSIASLDNSSPGVDFQIGGAPPVFPGGNEAIPVFVSDFRVTATPPNSPNGVGPGEYLGVTFGLLSGVTAQDVMDAIIGGSLRFGLHVQSLPDGDSDAYINGGNPIPSPDGFLLGLLRFAKAFF